jgi:hypothetical protein
MPKKEKKAKVRARSTLMVRDGSEVDAFDQPEAHRKSQGPLADKEWGRNQPLN